MEVKLTREMIEDLNSVLESIGTSLRYIRDGEPSKLLTSYRLQIIDKYIDEYYYTCPSVTEEFVTLVRSFFKDKYEVEDLGFTNTIATIFAKN